MIGVMVDAVLGGARLVVVGNWLAGVEVAVETGEVARRDLDPDIVPGSEQVRCHPAIDRKLVDLAGGQ